MGGIEWAAIGICKVDVLAVNRSKRKILWLNANYMSRVTILL